MSGRRIVPLVVAAFAALPITALSASAAQAPIDVVLSEPKCSSQATEEVLKQLGTPEDLAKEAAKPTVSYELRGREFAGNSTPFRIDVNGETRATGAVGSRGTVRGSFTLPSKRTHVRVVSGDQVLAERVYEVRC